MTIGQLKNTKKYTRREFVASSAILVGLGLTRLPITAKRKLSFSTLGCPDWDFRQITAFAAAHGYDGIELRGIQRELDLTKSVVFNTAQARSNALSLMRDTSLDFAAFGASTRLHVKEANERQHQLDEAKRFIELAVEMQCPSVRVFPDRLPEEQEREETIDLITSGLVSLGNFAKDTGVKVLMETHGDVVYAEDILRIMQSADHPQTGLVWDVFNMWVVTDEDVEQVYRTLAPYIQHLHLKDGKKVENGIQYTLLGQGNAPVSAALRALAMGNYQGYHSFEWEKLWHPELLGPEAALADFPKFMERYLF